ncbi:MAG: hypothetical protein DMF71_19025, partial [Acidobacteria bacterium]
MPNFYQQSMAPIDLFYVTGLKMNVSNLGTSGNYIDGAQAVLVGDSHYGLSHNADSAVSIMNVRQAILDRLECLDGANTIRADAATGRLTVIDSIYDRLDSQAATTKVINTHPPDRDPVLYVRDQYESRLGREPDAAGHYYWSESILRCGDDTGCVAERQALLQSYLGKSPAANFSISGQVKDDQGAPLSGVVVSLGGSQMVATGTDANGRYGFSNLPTSGVYTVSPSRTNYGFDLAVTVTTPSGDQTANFVGSLNRYAITGQITRADGRSVAGVSVSLSGAQSGATTSDANGNYSFNGLPAGGDYSVAVSRANYSFLPATLSVVHLQSNQTANFVGTIASYQVSGTISKNGLPLPNVTVTISGPQTAVDTTDADGKYSFTVPAEENYAITPSRANHTFTPPSIVVNSLSANQDCDFGARLNPGVPILISDANSTRAIALDSVLRTAEPFQPTYELPWSPDNRTRLKLFAANFDLLP